MKATKVLGIVLGTLLVAGLFVGAAAAEDHYIGTINAYQLYTITGVDLSNNATWANAAGNVVTFLPDSGQYYIDGKEIVSEGVYSRIIGDKKYFMDLRFPTAAVSGNVTNADGELIGALINAVVGNDMLINFTAGTYAFTNPAGTLTTTDFKNISGVEWTTNFGGMYKIEGLDLGTWTVQAYIDTVKQSNVYTKYAPKYLLGQPYYFTVVSSDDSKKIEAVDAEIIQGGYASIMVTAPAGVWNISVENGEIPAGQPLVGYYNVKSTDGKKIYYNITIDTEGVGYFTVTTDDTSNIKVELLKQKKEYLENLVQKSVTVKVKSGSVTATTKDASVFIGNEFDIEGTNDLGGTLYFFIKGTNYKFQPILDDDRTPAKNLTTSGKEWTATVKTQYILDNGKKPDAGTYTIYAASLNNFDQQNFTVDGKNLTDLEYEDMDKSRYVKAYATASVALKQPFITITKAPEVLVQGEKLVVEGSAEGEPDKVQFYIFGTNFFKFGDVTVTDGTFSVELSKTETGKDEMSAGQYFLVIQHPMYDKKFNIGANTTKKTANYGNVILNKTGKWNDNEFNNTVLFNTNVRQSANAAQALCDALDSQDIDDMYAKASFIVAGPTSYIDAIPSQITKGQVLTISGTTTGHKDDVVSVELLSTAFAAIPKEAVGSASFVALTTKIGEDGVWSISFDTSNLNADEYTCSVAVGQLDATSSKITIVEGAGPQPTQTAGPVTPTAQPTAQPTATPATPGFGALAALAGLGAVAVLLLRRQ